VTSETDGSRVPSITVRPSVEEKRLFSELAARRGISESKLALAAVRSVLRTECLAIPSIEPPPQLRDPGTDRITIRLRPGDLRAIATRAAIRRMKPSTYIAGLVRGHVLANPPLATVELEEFKRALTKLIAHGTLFAKLIRGLRSEPNMTEFVQQLLLTRAAVDGLERRMHALARESIRSWESNYG
jgi:hypothetical protein